MKRVIHLLSVIALNFQAYAQDGLGYYHDQSNNFFVFDNGIEHRLDFYPATGIMSGIDYLAYTDSKQSFMYYYQGQTQLLEENYPNSITATRTALVYKMQQRLMIVQKGEKKLLSRHIENYQANDSLVVWQDWPSMNYMIYQAGKTRTIITADNSSDMVRDYKTGTDLIAFSDRNFDLKVWYKDSIYDTGANHVASYSCAHGIVAFVDEYKNTLNVFYEGEIKVLSTEIIKEYKVANDMVAYIDAKDNFYIFYMGALNKIDSRRPEFYLAKGNIFCYAFDSRLKIIYDGIIKTINLVDPRSLVLGDNSLLFYSNINSPQFFYKGKIYDRFYVPKPYTMSINNDLPVFQYSGTVGFLYEGKISDFGVRSNSLANPQ